MLVVATDEQSCYLLFRGITRNRPRVVLPRGSATRAAPPSVARCGQASHQACQAFPLDDARIAIVCSEKASRCDEGSTALKSSGQDTLTPHHTARSGVGVSARGADEGQKATVDHPISLQDPAVRLAHRGSKGVTAPFAGSPAVSLAARVISHLQHRHAL